MSKKFYAVVNGRRPGIYGTWFGAEGAEAQVNGFPNAVYKGFPSRNEAERWYRQRTAAGVAPQGESLAAAEDQPIAVHPTQIVADPASYAQDQVSRDDPTSPDAQVLEASQVVIYTDGGCLGNPGRGGYGAVLLAGAQRKELSGGYAYTTNNRMELMACIVALQALKQPARVALFSDSSYVVNGISKGWAKRWRAKNWQRMQDGILVPARNADLWQTLLDLCALHEVRFVQVRGHAGVAENERCHTLASRMLQQRDLPPDLGFVQPGNEGAEED